METLTINASKAALTEAQFYNICRQNEELRFEMTAQGDLIVMPPVGGLSGDREMSLGAKVWNWNDASSLGRVFIASAILFRT
ncbi:Uma2 family endonuclease [Acaryochloris marina]|uniref:Uma2 family endonuclease n=1 Tax=Acaryochloris marina TaxID=155978 RepID=UPI001BB0479A|nr:Uma2 family endonuclease [Acaryochloris marina]QUY42556.1 Uma2 family endonuclease [Acaryochloris marina S15]